MVVNISLKRAIKLGLIIDVGTKLFNLRNWKEYTIEADEWTEGDAYATIRVRDKDGKYHRDTNYVFANDENDMTEGELMELFFDDISEWEVLFRKD